MGQEAWPHLENLPLDTPLINLVAVLQQQELPDESISSIRHMLAHYAQNFARRERRIANLGDLVRLTALTPQELQAEPRVGTTFEGFIFAGTTNEQTMRARRTFPLLANAS